MFCYIILCYMLCYHFSILYRQFFDAVTFYELNVIFKQIVQAEGVLQVKNVIKKMFSHDAVCSVSLRLV